MARKKTWTYTRGTTERYASQLAYAWGSWFADDNLHLQYWCLYNNDGAGRNIVVIDHQNDFNGDVTVAYMRPGPFGSAVPAENFQPAQSHYGPVGGVSPFNPNGQQPPGQILYALTGSPIGDVPIGFINGGFFTNALSIGTPVAIIPPGSSLIVSSPDTMSANSVAFVFLPINF